MRAIRYLLTLTACVLLALPTGWCCLFGFSAPTTTPTTKVSTERCGSCCPHERPQQEDEPPSRAPMTWCCCENLVPLRKDASPDLTPDLVVSDLPALDVPLASDYFLASAPSLCLSPSRPLHVLQCLWLC